MQTYQLYSGETLEYPTPTPAVAEFIGQVHAAMIDSGRTMESLLSLVYSVENPILDTASVPGRAIVTKATLENPIFHVLTDMVYRKQLAESRKTPEDALATFTLTVKDVAQKLGLTETAVRSARAAGKLAALKRNGEWYFRPESIAAYKVSNRGRKKATEQPDTSPPHLAKDGSDPHAVSVICGSEPGGSLAVRIADAELVVVGKNGNKVVAHFPRDWKRAVVKTTTANGVRVFELVPSTAEDAELKHEVQHLGFLVSGEFKIVKKHNATKAANDAWKRYATA